MKKVFLNSFIVIVGIQCTSFSARAHSDNANQDSKADSYLDGMEDLTSIDSSAVKEDQEKIAIAEGMTALGTGIFGALRTALDSTDEIYEKEGLLRTNRPLNQLIQEAQALAKNYQAASKSGIGAAAAEAALDNKLIQIRTEIQSSGATLGKNGQNIVVLPREGLRSASAEILKELAENNPTRLSKSARTAIFGKNMLTKSWPELGIVLVLGLDAGTRLHAISKDKNPGYTALDDWGVWIGKSAAKKAGSAVDVVKKEIEATKQSEQ